MDYSNASSRLLENSKSDHKTKEEPKRGKKDISNLRNLLGFWLLGLCNNFAYVVMLSAAHDILHQSESPNRRGQNGTESPAFSLYSNSSGNATHIKNDGVECNPLSTGTILLADILPTLFIKLTAPFYMNRLNYHIRIAGCILFAFASFFLIAYSEVLWVSLFGVVCASISGGFGEITLLSFSAHFDKNVVSTWSSGTGAAGLFGALSYAGLISAGVTPKVTVLLMNVVPLLMGVSFWVILVYPSHLQDSWKSLYSPDYHHEHTIIEDDGNTDNQEQTAESLSLKEKLVIVKSLLVYMVPLALVYFAEYFINQGLHELIFFKGIWITPADQYRWYQVDYQLAVLISRSSVNIAPIRNTCLLAILQYVNLVVLLFEAIYHFIPSIWIIFAIVMFEGLLGGAVYVNSFYRISKEVIPSQREFSMGVASIADSFGIAIAGLIALPTHNALCNYWLNKTS